MHIAQLYNRTIALMHAPICLRQLMALMAEMALTAEIGGGPILAMVEGGAELVWMADWLLQIADDGG